MRYEQMYKKLYNPYNYTKKQLFIHRLVKPTLRDIDTHVWKINETCIFYYFFNVP